MQPSILQSALTKHGLTEDIIELCLNFLTNRQQCVKIGDKRSVYKDVRVGVPQGTIAGPLFWLAFIDSYEPPQSLNVKYADDITCSHAIRESQDSTTNNIIEWGKSWCQANHMTLNLTKTKCMLLTLGPNSKAPSIHSVVSQELQWKFLGIFIDNHLTFDAHIDYVTTKANKRYYALLQLKKLGFNSDKLCLFYISNIRSVITYCIPAFFSMLSNKQIEFLERIQRQCTKIILPHIDSYTERLLILNLPKLVVFSEKLYKTHFFKIFHNHEHPLHTLIPERQSHVGRHSSRLQDRFHTKSRTAKRSNSFFYYGCNNFL